MVAPAGIASSEPCPATSIAGRFNQDATGGGARPPVGAMLGSVANSSQTMLPAFELLQPREKRTLVLGNQTKDEKSCFC